MTTAEKIARAKTDYEEVYTAGYTKGKAEGGGGGITPSGEIELTENNKTYDVTQYASAKVNVAESGGGEMPTLFAPTIALANGDTEINITDGNGDFATYEVYIDGVKAGEVTNKDFAIADITASNATIQIFVKAVASLFNASENSNVVARVPADGTPGLAYTLSSNGTYYTCSGKGTATGTEIIIASSHGGIPVTEIGLGAFLQTQIQSIMIPASINKIGQGAFKWCSDLKKTIITDLRAWCNITFVDYASSPVQSSKTLYIKNTLLTDAIIPDGVTTLKEYVFSYCESLVSVQIPSSVTRIAENAFSYCINLERVDLTAYGVSGTFPVLSSTALTNSGTSTASGTFQILVPSGRKAALAAMTNWSAYADNIVEV